MTLLLLSPHRDDAAFSCGITMHSALEAGMRLGVLNIFTRSEYAPFTTLSGVDAVSAARLAEDRSMVARLGGDVTLLDLPWADAPVRRSIPPEWTFDRRLDDEVFDREVAALAEELCSRLQKAPCVLLPLANQHLDHKISRAAVECCVSPDRIAYYEDLPYFARLTQEDRRGALETFVPSSTAMMLIVHPRGREIKNRLASCYPSQVDFETIADMASYGNERARQTRAAEGISNAEAGAEVVFAGPAARTVLERLGAKTITL